jgi:hypothetical protein
MFNGKTHYKWPCSIAMLNYQRVNITELPDHIAIVSSKAHRETCVEGPVPGPEWLPTLLRTPVESGRFFDGRIQVVRFEKAKTWSTKR